jgi:type II secretory pathway pseudopilin PulG
MRHPRGRTGLTIVELLLSVVVTAIVGLAMMRTLRGTLLFGERSERAREARSVARGSLALVESDLASVTSSTTGTSAGESASGTSVIVRQPIAMGTLCSANGSTAVVSLLPVDSVAWGTGAFAGSAWRASSGDWTYVAGGFTAAALAGTTCTSAGVLTLTTGVGAPGAPAGRTVQASTSIPASTPAGSLVLFYRRVQYEFATSVENPGRTALWRRLLAATGTTPVSSFEVAGPFATGAGFEFYTGTSRVPTATVPTDLRTIRGLDLVLPGQSLSGGRDGSARAAQTIRTSVFFRNRLD